MALSTPALWTHFHRVNEEDPSVTGEEFIEYDAIIEEPKYSYSDSEDEWKERDKNAWSSAACQIYNDTYHDARTGWYDEPIDYAKLPPNVWYMILSSLNFRDMCNMAMVCPFFHKIVGADYQRLCRRFNVYRCPGETFVYAFSELFLRGTNEVLYDYKSAVYLHQSHAICVLSLYLNDPNPTYITARRGIFWGEIPCLVQHNTKIVYFIDYPNSTSVFIHDVGTGELLKMVIFPGRHYSRRYVAYCEEGSNMLFSAASMRIHRVPIEGDLWISATANDLKHDYYVLHNQTQTFIYDTMTEKCVEMPRYMSSWGKKREAKNLPQKYSTQLLLGSNSYIFGDVGSFCIYNIQTGEILLEHSKRRKRKDWKRHRELFLVVNDFIVVDRDEKEIFFYDKADQTWKSSKTASPRVQQRLFRETFGSVLMAKYIWPYSTAYESHACGRSWRFRWVVEERYNGAILPRIYDYVRRSKLSFRRWLSYYYNKYISNQLKMVSNVIP